MSKGTVKMSEPAKFCPKCGYRLTYVTGGIAGTFYACDKCGYSRVTTVVE